MNKTPLKMLPRYLLGLLTVALSARLVAAVFLANDALRSAHWLVQLLPALVYMGIALAAHLLAKGRKWLYIFSYLINAFASGCAVGAVLGDASLLPDAHLLIALLPAAAIGAAASLLLTSPRRFARRLATIGGTIGALALIGIGIYIWDCRDVLAGCALVFSGLFLLPFPIGCNGMLDEEEQERYRSLSFTGFGAFIAIAFVAAIILTDGEILDGLDGFDFGGGEGSGSKKAKPKTDM